MSQATPGYYRSPTMAGDQIVFVSEDDLWTVPRSGGVARRLTSGLGRTENPSLSPDGKTLAFASTEEGHSEVYFMPSDGGRPERITYLGQRAQVVGWTLDNTIVFSSNHQQAFPQIFELYTIDPSTRAITKLETGPGAHISFEANRKGSVLARHGVKGELAYWKRYRGGTAGEIWIDRIGTGDFKKFIALTSNTARPFWIGDRIYFISDHEGIGNVYCASLDGTDLKRHTFSTEFYVRGLNTDGQNLIFHAGGDLWTLELGGVSEPRKVAIEYRSPRTQMNRKFVQAYEHLEDYELHPKGERVVVAARGKTFSFDNWKGPVFEHGELGTFRHRLGRFTHCGKRIVLVSDAGGEESLEIHDIANNGPSTRLSDLNLGRVLDMKLSPVGDEALVTNHRNELIWVDLKVPRARVLDRSENTRIQGFNWSHDGRFVAYSRSVSERTSAVFIADIAGERSHRVTDPILRDVSPVFDPKGEYLYFISFREFDPVYDNLHFDLSFPRGSKPYLLTLRKDVLSPFAADNPGRGGDNGKGNTDDDKRSGESSEELRQLKIDFDGIRDRIIPLPVPEGRYRSIAATETRIFFTRMPIEGSLKGEFSRDAHSKALLDCYDLVDDRTDTVVNGMTSFRISQDGKHLIYRAGSGLRLIRAGEKISSASAGRDEPGKRSGWIDLARVQIDVRPPTEWRQMYREAWRLQRDHFWTEDMSKIDWVKVYERYEPLIDRISTRSELSDLLWEMQGELGTSHAYELGGDYRYSPYYTVGSLGAEWDWSDDDAAWKLTRVVRGDLWDLHASSPLARAGVSLSEGDLLLKIDGQPLDKLTRPEECLVYKARKDVSITAKRAGEEKPRDFSVRTLTTDTWARYRDWVEGCRKWVSEKTEGRVGYIHIPDMGPWGYAEFHRYFLVESEREGLIIDVRFNGGGHVSQLLLEKLARRRLGYSTSRWFGTQPFPEESAAGPMVAITNEYAGSDGDIFSHAFKLLRLGPLVGKRTWGGVIGISPSHSLSDGSVTTQPEYSIWFPDVGWKLENYGTEPDIVVEYGPRDYVKSRDPQLERATREVMKILEGSPMQRPNLDQPPDLSLPTLSP